MVIHCYFIMATLGTTVIIWWAKVSTRSIVQWVLLLWDHNTEIHGWRHLWYMWNYWAVVSWWWKSKELLFSQGGTVCFSHCMAFQIWTSSQNSLYKVWCFMEILSTDKSDNLWNYRFMKTVLYIILCSLVRYHVQHSK
jgi:hypothetical protein